MIIINVAIVENNDEYVAELRELLEECRRLSGYTWDIALRPFKTGEEFLKTETAGYHIVFMDIDLDGAIDGIETARILRKRGCNIPLAFLTSFNQYVFTGYKVNAIDYILKPIRIEQLQWCMERVFEMKSQGSFICKTRDGIMQIPYDQILYFQSSFHYIEIFAEDKKKYQQLLALKKLREALPLQFIQCHRTILVNAWKIDCINGKEIKLTDGTRLPVSNTYLDVVRNVFMKRGYS